MKTNISKIIEKITNQLSGDRKKDLQLLKNEAEKYKNHKDAREIIKEIGRMIFKLLPGEAKNEYSQILKNILSSIEKTLAESKLKIQEGKLDEAERMLMSILPHIERYKEDKASIYLVFNEPFEQYYYKYKFKPEKEIRTPPELNTEVFSNLAYILVEKRNFDKAIKIIDDGLVYNPINTNLLFEKAEIYKLKKDWNKFKNITNLCLEYSYKRIDIARVYRNFGYMFIELQDYDAAICSYLMSMKYDNINPQAQSQLFYISQISNKKIDIEYYDKRSLKILNERGIQKAPSKEVLELAYSLGRNFEESNNFKAAIYFYIILFELAFDDKIKKKIDNLMKADKQRV